METENRVKKRWFLDLVDDGRLAPFTAPESSLPNIHFLSLLHPFKNAPGPHGPASHLTSSHPPSSWPSTCTTLSLISKVTLPIPYPASRVLICLS